MYSPLTALHSKETFTTAASHPVFHRIRAFAIFCAFIAMLTPHTLFGASILIPVANRVDHVYDPTRNLLYITATDGTLQRWSVTSKSLLAPYTGGVNLSGVDITPDAAFAYAGESSAGATSGFVRKINLNDGTHTNISYNLSSLETGVDEVRLASNGNLFFTTNFAGSGWTPLHIINISNDSQPPSPRSVRQSTGIAGGPDHSLLLFQESNISSGPIFTYSANTGTFPAARDTNTFVGSVPAAVNRNGTLITFGNSLLNTSLNTIDIVPGSAGGYQFDPFRDLLYVADTATDSVRIYNSTNLAFLGQISIGQDITGGNRMSISNDTKYLFVTTSTGVRMIDNILAVPEPHAIALLLAAVPALSVFSRRQKRSAATKRYAPGFSPSHARRRKPVSISAALLLVAIGSVVETAALQAASILIPVANRVDHVFDPTRGLLYISATDGTIQRWSVASKSLLAPYAAGVNLSGIDITPDGAYAYAGEFVNGATSGFIRKVNLNDGTHTNISYNLSSLETGVDEVRLANNGELFFTTNFAGSGWNPLHVINIADDSQPPSPRTVNQSTGIALGPDRSLFFFQESNISSGPIFTYNANTGTFPAAKDTNSFVGGLPAAVNRNGTRIAFRNSLLDTALNTIDIVPGSAGGYQFDPFRDMLYVADTATDSVRVYNSSTLAFLGQISIGQDITGGNRMSISNDTNFLFVTTSTGVRMLDNTFAVPEPVTVMLGITAAAIVLAFKRLWKRPRGFRFCENVHTCIQHPATLTPRAAISSKPLSINGHNEGSGNKKRFSRRSKCS